MPPPVRSLQRLTRHSLTGTVSESPTVCFPFGITVCGMEGSGAARELRRGVGSGYAAIDTASGVAVLAVASGDVTRSTDAISSKKRRRSGGPARAAREAAFLASTARNAIDDAQTQMGADARGKGGRGWDWDLDYPYPLMPLVYVLLGMTPRWADARGKGGGGV